MRAIHWLLLPTLLATASPALATPFTVLGWENGLSVSVNLSGANMSVLAVQFHEDLAGVIGTSFCTELTQHIGTGGPWEFTVYDPTVAETAIGGGDPSRSFVWAAQISNAWANGLDALDALAGVTRAEAITGVQLAVWEAVYGDAFTINAMTAGTQSVYDYVLHPYSGYGSTVIVASSVRQDQLFTPPVPEPGAIAVFGLGALLVGEAVRRRQRSGTA